MWRPIQTVTLISKDQLQPLQIYSFSHQFQNFIIDAFRNQLNESLKIPREFVSIQGLNHLQNSQKQIPPKNSNYFQCNYLSRQLSHTQWRYQEGISQQKRSFSISLQGVQTEFETNSKEEGPNKQNENNNRRIPNLGIVSQMSKGVQQNSQLEFLKNRFKFEVVEFFPDGQVLETCHSPTSLGLNPRDISLFAHNTAPQSAAIAVRGAAILFRTELCRAIVFEDRAVLFPCAKQKHSILVAEAIHSRITSFLSNGIQQVPFEFRVLEALLDQTSEHFENKARRLGFLADCVVNDISHSLVRRTAFGELQRLLPVQRSINQLINDVEETRQALEELADDDAEVVKMCLSSRMDCPPPPLVPNFPDFLLATALLDSYARRIRSVHGNLKEQEDHVESNRMIWHMQLDSARNRIIRLNLFLSVSSFSAVIATIPPSLFGMNVPNGLEETTGAFQAIMTGSLSFSIFVCTVLFFYYRFWPRRFHKQRVQDMNALRDILVNHVDNLDEITTAVRRNYSKTMTKREFAALVTETVGEITHAEIDVLYKVFDTNKDGFLKVSAFVKDKDFGQDITFTEGFPSVRDGFM
eukprot:TRINITY_DN3892_c1_g3_i1.p1 TRINITY_DN3892_c1_g3~~TRINITY_DN3892_c1_g3_i1.p1  ORF type:complete len:581 (-),score=44.19 TRINITY_DN3892_c1_g3_i1:330-2072(-)